ncbi:MAG: transposase [Bacteroidota bacterium]
MPDRPYPKNIPHDPLGHAAVHITYRLYRSLPKQIFTTLAARRQKQIEELEDELLKFRPDQAEEVRRLRTRQIDGRYELAIDQALHQANIPQSYSLTEAFVRQTVRDSWLHLQQRETIFLYALCIMGNHVHVILRSFDETMDISVAKVMNNHKGYTARIINRQRGQIGTPFWAKGYFDRRIRQGKFMTAMWYMLNNPVKAGLVEEWQDWAGTYVHPDYVDLFVE